MGKTFDRRDKVKQGKRGARGGHVDTGRLDDVFAEVSKLTAPASSVTIVHPKPSRPFARTPINPAQAVTTTTEQMGHRSDTKLLKTETFRGDGKIFYLDAVKNERGSALRIAEVSKGKRTIIMVPAALLAAFEETLGKITPFVHTVT